MRHTLIALMIGAFSFLTACGELNKPDTPSARLTESCIGNGARQVVCECLVNGLEEDLSSETFLVLADNFTPETGLDVAEINDLNEIEKSLIGVSWLDHSDACLKEHALDIPEDLAGR